VELTGVLGLIPSLLNFASRFFENLVSEDLDQFVRRLRMKEYCHSKKETSEDLSTDESDIDEVIDIPRFVKKSNWIPKPSNNTRLESVIDLVK
jgi:hypothetical protein